MVVLTFFAPILRAASTRRRTVVVDPAHDGQLHEAERATRDLLVRYRDVHDGFERFAMVYTARVGHERVDQAEKGLLGALRMP